MGSSVVVLKEDGSKESCERVELTTREMNSLADDLDKEQAKQNDGRGIRHIQSIVHFLRQGDLEIALGIYQSEGDKTNMYPTVRTLLENRLGCRVHGVLNCPSWFCSRKNGN